MIKISVFNKNNDVLIVDTFKNNPKVYASLSIQCHILYMLVGLLQKADKNVSSVSGQVSTGL